jgi:predicted PurR-regulated permease PerM
MNRKYVIAGLIGFAAILGWNVFLIQRDERLYDSYYRAQAIENLKKPPSAPMTIAVGSFIYLMLVVLVSLCLTYYFKVIRPKDESTLTKMLPKRLRDLIKQAEMDKVAEEFWKEVEREAAKLEVTVDYYLAEFY